MYMLLLLRRVLLLLCLCRVFAALLEASAAAVAIMVKLLSPPSTSSSALTLLALSSRDFDGNEDCADDDDDGGDVLLLRCFFDLDFAMAAIGCEYLWAVAAVAALSVVVGSVGDRMDGGTDVVCPSVCLIDEPRGIRASHTYLAGRVEATS